MKIFALALSSLLAFTLAVGCGTSAPAVDTQPPMCWPDGGFADNACDLCENSACCGSRFACYDDTACDQANMRFDDCLVAAGTDAAMIATCWATFEATNATSMARVACQRAHCRTECSVP